MHQQLTKKIDSCNNIGRSSLLRRFLKKPLVEKKLHVNFIFMFCYLIFKNINNLPLCILYAFFKIRLHIYNNLCKRLKGLEICCSILPLKKWHYLLKDVKIVFNKIYTGCRRVPGNDNPDKNLTTGLLLTARWTTIFNIWLISQIISFQYLTHNISFIIKIVHI